MAARAIAVALVLALAAVPTLAQSQSSGQTPAPQTPAKAKKDKPAAAPKDVATKPDAGGDPVVARVNGAPVFRSDLEVLRSTLPPQMQQQPPDKLYPQLLQLTVALQLVMQSARKAEADRRSPRQEASSPRWPRSRSFRTPISTTSSAKGSHRGEGVKERYDQGGQVRDPPQEEVHARQIVVATEDEAKQIIEQLKKGADFAKLAADKTTEPAGKASGGDLGYLHRTRTWVPEFAKAAFALKPGEISQTPVKTEFGWHVIKVEDRRISPSRRPSRRPHPSSPATWRRRSTGSKWKSSPRKPRSRSSIPTAASRPRRLAAGATPAPQAAPAAQSAAPAPVATGQPQLMPMQNGTPGEPPPRQRSADHGAGDPESREVVRHGRPGLAARARPLPRPARPGRRPPWRGRLSASAIPTGAT